MKKLLSAALLSALSMLFVNIAHAVCPVCTIAVGAGLEGARLLGVDDLITGIWAGGLTLSVVFWTANFMHRKGVQSAGWYLLNIVGYYTLLFMIYLLPGVNFGADTIFGIDKLFLGILSGTIAFWIGAKWYHKIKRQNGGKPWFKFQKVIWPFGMLLILSLVACLIV